MNQKQIMAKIIENSCYPFTANREFKFYNATESANITKTAQQLIKELTDEK